MRMISMAVVVFALSLASRPAVAQFGGGQGGMMMGPLSAAPKPGSLKPYPVQVESGGGHVSGTLRLATVVLRSDLGQYEIKPEKVREIRFLARQANEPYVQIGYLSAPVPGVIVTRTGEELKGNVIVQQWQLETELGTLTLNPDTLKLLTFAGHEKEKAGKEKAEKEKEKPARLTLPGNAPTGTRSPGSRGGTSSNEAASQK